MRVSPGWVLAVSTAVLLHGCGFDSDLGPDASSESTDASAVAAGDRSSRGPERVAGSTPDLALTDKAVILTAFGPAPPPVCTVSGRALFVVEDETALNAGDVAVRDRLLQLGLQVTIESDGQLDSNDPVGKVVIVVSASVESSLVNTIFRGTAVPLVTWEHAIFDDLGMTPAASTDNGRDDGQTRVSVVGSAAPFAAGLSGNVQVLDASGNVRWGRPFSSATVAARFDGDSTRATYFAYETGASLANGRTAPARRVGTFFDELFTQSMTPAGWALFDTSIVWAVGTGSPRSVALLVTGDHDLEPGDGAVKARLEGLGFAVHVVRNSWLPVVPLAGVRLIVVTESVDSATIGQRFRQVAIPVVNAEAQLFDELGMASSFGTESGQTRIAITDAASPLAGGLTGQPTVNNTATEVVWASPGSAARVAATVVGKPARASLFSYEAGAAMPGLAAPARRVGFFMFQAQTLTSQGWTAFDASVGWAVATTPPGVPGLCPAPTTCVPRGSTDATCDGVDDDCDGAVDDNYVPTSTSCGVGACSRTGQLRCVSGAVVNTCAPGAPAANDAVCDGIDNDCSGATDEDYVVTPTTCGVGACSRTGQQVCTGGVVSNTCAPGTPAANDALCDGIDNDCSGATDEDYVEIPTTCGVGTCGDTGALICTGGVVSNTCAPGTPDTSDATCDGMDEDCDGTVDDDFEELFTTCGTGACTATGRLTCVDGTATDDCQPNPPAADDTLCDGIDNDCDGAIDEDYVPTATTCGVGACAAAGQLACVAGTLIDSCTAGTPAASDASCDGIDNDCNGAIDEDYVAPTTTCGVGACAATGQLACVAGAVTDTCTAGTPAANDAACDGIDNDCSGQIDEDYIDIPTTCGVGACSDSGALVCQTGAVVNTCAPGTPGASDTSCDGIDNDCSGAIDEDYVEIPTTCGVGTCGDTGALICVAGVVSDTCAPGTPDTSDATCDGMDEDCDGTVDDDFEELFTTCGIGACTATGRLTCVDGTATDDCQPNPPAADDTLCDGIDNDCDGAIDEDYVPTTTTCGVGACGAAGQLLCQGGALVDSCTAGPPAASDASCDGIDNDCDGTIDEDYVEIPTTCGVGTCGDTGALICTGGVVSNTCTPGFPDTNDATCDGMDEDCDGTIDDDFEELFTTCGTGACTATGRLTCVDGTATDDCQPNPPAADDTLCDGIDNDCDGAIDEDYVPTATTCGVGACAAAGQLLCQGGALVDSCAAGTPAASDASCDGIDNDCDGAIDEDYVAPPTTCGVGACAATGQLACVAGTVTDTCTAGTPAANDAACDGIDNDCSGQIDEDYIDIPTTCGIGACGDSGALVCQNGAVVNTCTPGAPEASDTSCDGIDNDCSGAIDEDYVPTGTSCGIGACGATGQLTCVAGGLVDTCTAGPPRAGIDFTCDNIDDDCDGRVDDDFQPVATTCGVGACSGTGLLTCTAGVVSNSCVVGTPAPSDDSCDGIDNDCSGQTDEDYLPPATSCGVGTCAATGVLACEGGRTRNTCAPGTPDASDASCDGLDNDCSGQIDEDYVGIPTTCGIGACGDAGALVCQDGAVVNTCTPGTPGASDATCDGIDNDCSGQTDEDYIPPATTCGVGTCAATGVLACEGGATRDTCAPGTPAASDDTCDGLDNDCSGDADEDYVPPTTTCGVGACGATGVLACENGTTRNTCAPGTPAANDSTCDGIDEDCDGTADDDFEELFTTCGIGACTATGRLTCVDGAATDDCAPNPPAAIDLCDGIDNDCNGDTDEDHVPTATTCGVGTCTAAGSLVCVDGALDDTCAPGTPGTSDATCDGLDNDCSGTADEDYIPPATTCGVGTCAATGVLACEGGATRDTCAPGAPEASDDTCDGLDNDCSGDADEDYVPPTTTCGVGACGATGVLACENGTTRNTCAPGTPAANDSTCDGIDEDCDGTADDDFEELFTTCGIGACTATGRLTCVDGTATDDCAPNPPAATDLCDGIDNDCNGDTDEDHVPTATTCGVGTCTAAGSLVCVDGALDDTCAPGTPAPIDLCDGLDNDCSGDIDEDHAEIDTTCGLGACAATGVLACENGTSRDTCAPGAPLSFTDATCDGVDDDCDGQTDEDFAGVSTTCGIGACAAAGALLCEGGAVIDTCEPGPAAASDALCDGIDSDCSGDTDEDYLPETITCGVGACSAIGFTACTDGGVVATCTPGTPGPREICDAIDNDCDGQTDEPDGTLRWSQVTLPGPPPRWGAAMARDQVRDRLILFGGSRSGVGSVAETWAWDGTGWELLTSDGPPERIDHAMTYDVDRDRVVVFGGLVDSLPAGDTWEWDGTSWERVATTGPSPRYATAMAYDEARGVTVLFGGLGAAGRLADTWEWDGTSWQQRASSGPTPRKGHTLDFDPVSGALLLIGGFDGLVQSDRWSWDGASWAFLGQAGGPAAREEHTVIFDEQRAALVMFGGITVFSQRLDDVWRLATAGWSRVTATGPSRRFLHTMGYDPLNQAALVYGGVTSTGATSGETWLLGEVCF